MTQGVHWTTAENLTWDEETLKNGQPIRLKKQSKYLTLRIHRIEKPTRSTDESYQYIVTNDLSVNSEAVVCRVGFRWKIEELHREVKQNTGIERCECRKSRAQRNHIACSMMAWTLLKRAANTFNTTIYQLKDKLLDCYMRSTLNSPPDYLKFA